MNYPGRFLEESDTILLVDWPNPGVPRALLEAGFTVFGYSPHHYSQAEIVFDRPVDVDSKRIVPPRNEGEKGYLIFRRLDSCPASVDIVSVYRPADELPGILKAHALPLRAKTVWLQCPSTSPEERRLVESHGFNFVEDADIIEVARPLRVQK